MTTSFSQKLFIALCILASIALAGASIMCKDEDGKNVDWWFIHKLPSLKKTKVSPNGFGYYYADVNNPLTLSPNKLDTFLRGAMGRTLSQYMGKTKPGWLAWSDQPPGTNISNSGAHAKGVTAFDDNSGFLLRHSTPRFPLAASTGAYTGFPDYARIYGQTFLCVSYSISTLNEIASQFILSGVKVYDSNVPNNIGQNYPFLATLGSDNTPLQKTPFNFRSFTSLSGNNFTDFAKSRYCDCELYSAIVAPALATDMAVLSWGRPLMGSGCRPATQFDVLDISGMTLRNTPEGTITYNETKEHSKLGFAAKGDIICVGDINRMTSQASRGGGTTCFSNPGLWHALTLQIAEWNACPR